MVTTEGVGNHVEAHSTQAPITGNIPGEPTPIACDLTAIGDEVRPQHVDRAIYLFGERLLERQELPNGYAFCYSPNDYRAVTDFIESERLCCPFFNFTLEVSPDGGPMWLRITGREGVKELLLGTLDDLTK